MNSIVVLDTKVSKTNKPSQSSVASTPTLGVVYNFFPHLKSVLVLGDSQDDPSRTISDRAPRRSCPPGRVSGGNPTPVPPGSGCTHQTLIMGLGHQKMSSLLTVPSSTNHS